MLKIKLNNGSQPRFYSVSLPSIYKCCGKSTLTTAAKFFIW